MKRPGIYWWSKMPMVRVLAGLITGILLQWQADLSFIFLLVLLTSSLAAFLIYFLLPLNSKYQFNYVSGLLVNLVMITGGALICWIHNINNHQHHVLNNPQPGNYVVATLQEPLVEKPNSFKSVADVNVVYDSVFRPTSGRIIIYFSKDSLPPAIDYGSKIVFKKDLQPIKNSGNPESFDYKRYCFFQGISHQVYLKKDEFTILPGKEINPFRSFIFKCRFWVISLIKKYIPGEREQGLAQALLIGYKDNLDKDLVQSYSNTGVVHVIAISGLHLGLIYSILLLLTKRMKKLKLPRLLLIVASLWIFSIIAGAQPSVLRSALMFSCIAFGEVISRKGSVYNTLALSAFILLCYNPYWLWDVGFQLSYAAVLSIMLFYKPVYNWFYIPNKAADMIWKMNAVTISAQLLTLPISIFHFHQFPTLFLFSNLVAVPLSSVILIGEIILCAIFFIEPLAHMLGAALHWLIFMMNGFIEKFELIPFAVWRNLSINVLQAILLTGIIIFITTWFLTKKGKMLFFSMAFLIFFLAIRADSFIAASRQNKLVIYNVPKYTAIDFNYGRETRFFADSGLLSNDFLLNFHVLPSRIHSRSVNVKHIHLPTGFEYAGKKIIRIDTSFLFKLNDKKQEIDLVILSKNPRLYIKDLCKAFTIRRLVIDSSVPAWKARLWKKDCDSLDIACFDVAQNGAFVMPF